MHFSSFVETWWIHLSRGDTQLTWKTESKSRATPAEGDLFSVILIISFEKCLQYSYWGSYYLWWKYVNRQVIVYLSSSHVLLWRRVQSQAGGTTHQIPGWVCPRQYLHLAGTVMTRCGKWGTGFSFHPEPVSRAGVSAWPHVQSIA